MFNIGGGEVLVIALIALIAVGPEQLPSVMRKVGGFVGQIRGMTAGLRDEFMSGVDDMKSTMEEANPNTWMGDGSDDKPIVPRGYAENTVRSTAGPDRAAQPDSEATNVVPNLGDTNESSAAEEPSAAAEPAMVDEAQGPSAVDAVDGVDGVDGVDESATDGHSEERSAEDQSAEGDAA